MSSRGFDVTAEELRQHDTPERFDRISYESALNGAYRVLQEDLRQEELSDLLAQLEDGQWPAAYACRELGWLWRLGELGLSVELDDSPLAQDPLEYHRIVTAYDEWRTCLRGTGISFYVENEHSLRELIEIAEYRLPPSQDPADMAPESTLPPATVPGGLSASTLLAADENCTPNLAEAITQALTEIEADFFD